ncbi:MAG: hypothetical protein QM296_13960 [Bacillota bacterium]|nr:hypothetical protein [Bacillota bacterium]
MEDESGCRSPDDVHVDQGRRGIHVCKIQWQQVFLRDPNEAQKRYLEGLCPDEIVRLWYEKALCENASEKTESKGRDMGEEGTSKNIPKTYLY